MKAISPLRSALAFLVLCGVASGCADAEREAAEVRPPVVVMTGSGSVYQYEPAYVVSADGVVEFINNSDMPHDVVWSDESLKASHLIKKGETWRVALPKPGVFEYVCTLHPGMKGVIEVSSTDS
jgi:plastocyanin